MTGDRPLRGVLLALLAVLIFATTDTLTKHLAETLPVPFIAFWRYAVSLVLLLAIYLPREGRAAFIPVRPLPVLFRALCLAAATLMIGHALRLMPVGETLAIVYLNPFLLMLAAHPLLGERVSGWGWTLAAAGFAGVLLVARPGAGLEPLGVALAFGCAVLSAAYNLMSRQLSRSESSSVLLVSSSAIGAAAFALMLPAALPVSVPDPLEISFLLLLGGLATLGHVLLTAAFRLAPASVVAPASYAHLFWATLLGLLVFGHLPDLATLAGIALVALAGAGAALLARRAGASAEPRRPHRPFA